MYYRSVHTVPNHGRRRTLLPTQTWVCVACSILRTGALVSSTPYQKKNLDCALFPSSLLPFSKFAALPYLRHSVLTIFFQQTSLLFNVPHGSHGCRPSVYIQTFRIIESLQAPRCERRKSCSYLTFGPLSSLHYSTHVSHAYTSQ